MQRINGSGPQNSSRTAFQSTPFSLPSRPPFSLYLIVRKDQTETKKMTFSMVILCTSISRRKDPLFFLAQGCSFSSSLLLAFSQLLDDFFYIDFFMNLLGV